MKKTEKLLIDITFYFLYRNGYCGTGLTEILKKADMTKGAMYYHFKSKHALVLSTITYYLDDMLKKQWIKPFENSEKPIETLVNQINEYKDMFSDKDSFLDVKHGSALVNFISDMSNSDDEISKYLQSVQSRWKESIEKALTKAQILKQTKTDFDAKKQSLFIISSIEGNVSSAKSYNDLNVLHDTFEVLIDYIENL